MITAKFGGTSITARNLYHLKEIITPFHNCVVVSAVGKEHFADTKTTDLLREYFVTQSEGVWQQIGDKYRLLVEVNGIKTDVEELLRDAKSRALAFDMPYCASLGEELSAKIVAKYLNAKYVEAEQVVRFKKGKLQMRQTYANARKAFHGVNLGVIGGFYGGKDGGRETFSRGGSDVTGAILAAALNSSLYENWTDVNGVCVANPSRVHGVDTIESMSYDEMLLLSKSGAEVLHPDAVAPVEKKGIPIKIGNFLNPFGNSTLISHCPSQSKLLSIAEKRLGDKVVTTVLHTYAQWQIAAVVSEFLRSHSHTVNFFDRSAEVSQLCVYDVEFQPSIARLTTDVSILNSLYAVLSSKF
ncbi:MAG: hypothetical protein J1F66_00140 [Clostridiales bacterium]|nr:hypothetical protein [Clostridiales bacterium]